MNIGIDIDDTITNTYETMLPMIALKYGKNLDKLMAKKPSYRTLHSILPNFDKFAYENYETMVKIVPLKDGVVDILNKLRNEGHKIIFITSRNYKEYEDPYKISLDYLQRNNIPFDKLIVNVQDKAKECMVNKIDLFIDDSTKHCKAVQNKGISTLQFDTSFNSYTKRLERVKSWEEVYQKVQMMYT